MQKSEKIGGLRRLLRMRPAGGILKSVSAERITCSEARNSFPGGTVNGGRNMSLKESKTFF